MTLLQAVTILKINELSSTIVEGGVVVAADFKKIEVKKVSFPLFLAIWCCFSVTTFTVTSVTFNKERRAKPPQERFFKCYRPFQIPLLCNITVTSCNITVTNL
jgi:hypothetical protein